MPKTQITSSKIHKPSGHFSQATSIAARGRLVFISGMTARCADGTIAGIGDIEVQTQQVCESIKAAVEQAGGTMDDICRVDVYVLVLLQGRTWPSNTVGGRDIMIACQHLRPIWYAGRWQ
jgi:enamine deaminase RidA (YjgF/YER057c/UK114 family)